MSKKIFSSLNRHSSSHGNNRGFTLVETLVAILILALCVEAVMSLAAGGFFSIKYAKNQMVATALAQESLEYIRNTRDTIYKQGGTWDDWLAFYNVGGGGNSHPGKNWNFGCFSSYGCTVSPNAVKVNTQNSYAVSGVVIECQNVNCSPIYYFPNAFGSSIDNTPLGFYGYIGPTIGSYPPGANVNTIGQYKTTYTRVVKMILSANKKEVTTKVTVSWLDGNTKRSITQSILITDWRP